MSGMRTLSTRAGVLFCWGFLACVPPAWPAQPAADGANYAAFIRVVGNEEDDTARLAHLRKLAEQCARDGVALAGLDRLLNVAATWVSPAVKYTAAGLCWTAVLAYFTVQGRRAG